MRSTVVIPVRNGAGSLSHTLDALIAQTRSPDEVVVVDDGSTDGTLGVLDEYRDRLPLNIVRHPVNLGVAQSLRDGVNASSGELILRCDADDRWHPAHAASLHRLAEEQGATLMSSNVRMVTPDGRALGVTPAVSDDTLRWQLCWDNPLVHSATGFRRDAYEAVGGYATHRRWEDYDLWIELAEIGRYANSGMVTVDYTVDPGSVSRIGSALARSDRMDLQMKAVRKFAARHPVRIAGLAAVLLMRRMFGGRI